jgi:hypothetical protein
MTLRSGPRSRTSISVLALPVSLTVSLALAPVAVRAIEFEMGFEGQPPAIRGSPGESLDLEAFARLTTSKNPSTHGAQGWSFVLHVEGAEIAEVSLEGIRLDTVYTPKPGTVIDPSPFDLDRASYAVAELIPPDPKTPGSWAFSAVVLDLRGRRLLPAEGSAHVARLLIQAVVPPAPGGAVTLEFAPAAPAGGLPVSTVVTWNAASVTPRLGSAAVPFAHASYRRGDAGSDGRVDVADAIALLDWLFQGGAEPGCLDAADANADAAIDLADPIIILMALFSPDGPSLPAPGPLACGFGPPGPGLGCAVDPACP